YGQDLWFLRSELRLSGGIEQRVIIAYRRDNHAMRVIGPAKRNGTRLHQEPGNLRRGPRNTTMKKAGGYCPQPEWFCGISHVFCLKTKTIPALKNSASFCAVEARTARPHALRNLSSRGRAVRAPRPFACRPAFRRPRRVGPAKAGTTSAPSLR